MRVKEKIKEKDNRQKAFTYLREKGYKDHEIAGILGNFVKESGRTGLKVDAYNKDDKGSPSFGLAQWRGTRLDRIKKMQGDNMYTLEGQLDHMDWELKNTEKKAYRKLKEAKTAEEAALAFSIHYERPYKPTAANDERQDYARVFFDSYSDADDKDLVYIKEEGNIKTKDRTTATTMELYDSQKYKEEVSGLAFDISSQNLQDSYLTNLQDTNNNAIFEEGLAEQKKREENKERAIREAGVAQAQEAWKDKLKNKIEKRNKLVDMISAGGFDLQFVEQNRKTRSKNEQV
jgi:predicted metal-dependent phosphoesterase TrpH